MNKKTSPPTSGQAWPRSYLINVFDAALAAEEYRFAHQVALSWLASYPGDLPVTLQRAKALIADGADRQALPILESLVKIDPEFSEAQVLLSETHARLNIEDDELAQDSAFALGGIAKDLHTKTPDSLHWSFILADTRELLSKGDLAGAEAEIQKILNKTSDAPICAVTHLNVLRKQTNTPKNSIHKLAEHYQKSWPECLQFQLIQAEIMMAGGESDKAVALLHKAVAHDVTGQVAQRLWGPDHKFKNLWPDKTTAYVYLQIPAEVSASLGWNLLGSSKLEVEQTLEPDKNVETKPGIFKKFESIQNNFPNIKVTEAIKSRGIRKRNAKKKEKKEKKEKIGLFKKLFARFHKPAFLKTKTKTKKRSKKIKRIKKVGFFQKMASRFRRKGSRKNTVPRPEVQPETNLKVGTIAMKAARMHAQAAPESRNLSEIPLSVEPELRKVRKATRRSNSEGRFPVYVVLTTQAGLQRKYGVETTGIVEEAIRDLVTSLRKRLDWGSIMIFADDPGNMAQYGLKPVPPDDPWKLKLALVDLDDALGKRGARIGALLIVGGPDVVPFHYLPNPTDDSDSAVPSDNPYATRDENYFIPEWPVGRLPGDAGKDPGLLLSTLRGMAERHATAKSLPKNKVSGFFRWIIESIQARRNNIKPSFGYSAEVWKDVSGFIYKTIGDPRKLFTSPPNEANKSLLPPTRLGYFNLHGVADSGEWFGQRDPINGSAGPEYPTALNPSDVVNGGRAPMVIFSEACYGANILEKSIDDALALKFLSSGSQAMVGSTVISYGSVTPPLNAADLLGKAFWKYFKDGFTAGESLRRAKITLAAEMHDRQGYLDGEDQKTLISFILYGDPMAQEKDLLRQNSSKNLAKIKLPKAIKTVCDRAEIPGTSEPISKEVIANVKNIVEQYLPGMRGATLCLSHEHADCSCEGHTCPTSQLGPKTRVSGSPNRRVVTLSKQIVGVRNVHEAYARVTVDKEGKVVKLTVSR